MNNIFKAAYQAAHDVVDLDGVEHAGYLSFVYILAFFPFLVLFTAFVGKLTYVFNGTKIEQQFVEFIRASIPDRVIEVLLNGMYNAINSPPHSIMTLAVFSSIWTSSTAVEGLRTILNRIYRVHDPPPYILRRALSILYFFVMLLIIIIIFGVITLLPSFASIVGGYLKINIPILGDWNDFRAIFGVLALFISVSCVYIIVPNCKVHIINILPGSVVVVCMWICGAMGMSYYIEHFDQVNVIYGSLAGVIVLLLFFYISNLCFIFGAALNYRMHKH